MRFVTWVPSPKTGLTIPTMATRSRWPWATARVPAGVLVCGSGIGMSIAANRHAGVRAALCHDGISARLSRQHNDANVLVLGGRLIGEETAKDCLRIFLNTPFEGGRHARRVEKLG